MKKEGHNRETFEIKILGYEADWWNRGVKEAIQIKRHKPSLKQRCWKVQFGILPRVLAKNIGKTAFSEWIGKNVKGFLENHLANNRKI